LASSSPSICSGQSANLTVTLTGTGPWTLNYTANGVAQAAVTANSSPYTLAVSPTSTTSYVLTGVSSGSCAGSVSGTAMVTVGASPTATLAPTPISICNGQSANLSIVLTGSPPWTLNYTANGVAQAAVTANSSPFLLSVTPSSTTAYALTGVNSGSCIGSASGTATVTVLPSPTAALSGGGQICQSSGIGATLTVNFTGTGPWTFVYSAGSTAQAPITTSSNPHVFTVMPSIGTTYQLVSVADATCSGTVSGTAVVAVFTPPTAALSGSQTVCGSANTTLNLDFTGTEPFTINYTANGIAQPPITTSDDPYLLPVNTSTTTTYVLTSVMSPGCNGIPSGTATITVNQVPSFANLNVNCNFAQNNYTVTFDVLNATPPLTLITGSGTFSGTQFTSAPIAQGAAYNFVFHDANNCGNVTASGPSTCNCSTDAGNMALAPALNLCQTATATATYNGGFVNDGNDSLRYILHTNPALPIGTLIAWNSSPSFTFGTGMTAGTTYYISAIAGNPNGNGQINLSDPCLSVSQGTPVTWYAPPVGDMGISNPTICRGDSVTLSINFTGNPPYSFATTIAGVQQPVVSNILTPSYSWNFAPQSSVIVALDSVADLHCADGQSLGSANIVVQNPPNVSAVQAVCDFSTATYRLSFSVASGVAPFSISGIMGTFTGNDFLSDPIPFSAPNYFATLQDANNCGQDTIAGLANCNCTSNAGTMSQTAVSACQTATLNVPATTGQVLDGDDILRYILHTTTGTPVGTILAWSSTPSFTFGGTIQTGTTYYVSAVVGNPDGNGQINLGDPCLSVAIGTPVLWNPSPSATLMPGTYNICAGGSQGLLVTLTGTPIYTLTYTNNGTPFTVSNIGQNAFGITATLLQDATFVLTAVTDATGCAGSVSGQATVNVNLEPEAIVTAANCSADQQTYTVEFDVIEGDLASIVVSSLPGTYDPSTGHFVSDPVPATQSYSFTLTDVWMCGVYTFSDSVACNCSTDAGTLAQMPLLLCDNEPATAAPLTGATLDSNDALLYALVTGNNPATWSVLETSTTPSFAFNSSTMTAGTTYYIVALAGDTLPNGAINPNDPCFSVAIGPAVSWRVPVTASLSGGANICAGNPISLNVQFTGSGPYSLVYTANGTQQTLNNITQNPYNFSINPSLTTNYALFSVTGEGNCPGGTVSGSATVTVTNGLQIVNVQEDCDLNAETYVLSFGISNGAVANPMYTITGLQGTLSDSTFTSVATSGMQAYNLTITDPSGCSTTLSGQPDCTCATDAGTLTNASNACLPNGVVSAQPAGNQSLDSDDVLRYILCQDPTLLPQGILAESATPQFGLQNGVSAGTTYFIVAVAGTALPNGSVDPSDPCLSISPGVPVVFRNPPTASLAGDQTLCAGANAAFQIQFVGQAPFNFVYAINGTPQPAISAPANTFGISTNNVQQTQVFTLVSVQDANCPGTAIGQATVNVNPIPTASLAGSARICAGDSAVLNIQVSGASSFSLTIAGGISPIQLASVQNDTTIEVSPSLTTSYNISSLTAIGNNCPVSIGNGATIEVVTLGANAVVSDYNGFNVSCPNGNDGSISINPNGGISPVTAAWSNGLTGLSLGTLEAGNYAVTLTDQTGCVYLDSFVLNAPPEVGIEFSVAAPRCYGDETGSVTLTNVVGGVGPFSLVIDGNRLNIVDNFPVTIGQLAAGPHSVGLEDANGCLSDVEANIPAPAELLVDLGPDTVVNLGDSLRLLALTNSTAIDTFIWSPTDYLSTPGQLESVSKPLHSLVYTMFVRDSAGCTARDEVQVAVRRAGRIYVPNIIYPASTESNNVFMIFAGSEVRGIKSMRIFDRWGEMVFENRNFLPNDPQFGWSGNAKGQPVNPAVYVYVIELEYITGETTILSGDVTVIR
jgi:hypothetical protein